MSQKHESHAPAAPESECALSRAELSLFVHELRGTLTVISGYTGLLGHPLGKVERRAALRGIERAIERANGMCSDAMAGRPPRSRQEAPDERVLIPELAEQIAADQGSAAGRKVTVCAQNAESLSVPGDAHALARVFGNLVGNALKYSPADSVVEILVAPGIASDGTPVAVIEVADRGAGIPADERERIFEPFERLKRDESLPGTGLGLAVVRDVVEAHAGDVRIQSREGGGTIVHVELPVAD
ncbi:MAG: HAMP domain-containing histidine kinase [Coriobacteriia bacterium]|nr:HAMP domain-containing histidine kinase [Coriobacteriia bacterium]